mgnify:CR=1 FL=1
MSNKIWKQKPTADSEKVQRLVDELNAPDIIANILCQRGVDTPEKVRDFYNPKLSSLHNPFLMKDMDAAISRITAAIKDNEGVLVFGDYDVDGTTSVALAYSFFKSRFSKCDYYIPDRYKEGYGISKDGIDYAKTNNLSLIIALDCGIRSVELVDYAKSLDIDFIICDHHLPGKDLPKAAAVLDPKRDDCNYPFKELAGCGIGFKLAQAYCITNNLDLKHCYQYLDFVTLSIASDIVPIVGENRVLAHYGLKIINKQPRLGVQKLIEVSLNKPELSIGDLVFYLGPRINAAGRMGDAKNAVKMLIATEFGAAEDFAKKLHDENTSRKVVDEKITADFKEIVVKDPALLKQKTLVFFNDSWHKGVVGIAASRAIEEYYRPTIILTKSGDVLVGSARSVVGFDVHEALTKCSEHLLQFGGHKYAAGMTLLPENLDAFKKAFEQVGQEMLNEELLTPKVNYDWDININEVNMKLVNALEKMAPFGPGNMTPVFCAKSLNDNGSGKIIGKTQEHLRLNVKQNEGSIAAVGFGMAPKMEAIKKADSFEACFQLNINSFRGQSSIQLMLKDLRATNDA